MILNALGVDDFGIYNVVGGFVSMFAVFTSAMAVAVSRFITFELGRSDPDSLKKVFSTSLFTQVILAILIVFLTESIGLWFLNNKLVIPAERLSAANWVFQFSVATFSLSLIGIPFQSAVIAHERMTAYAGITLIDTLTKLLIALSISFAPIDKLIWYGLLMAFGAMITQLLYVIYGRCSFAECKSGIRPDHNKLKEMFGFAGWNVLGGISAIIRDQGGNIVLNMFFGPVVNAARGIANQICFTVNSFVTSFQTAINPQITKSYASGDYNYLHSLVFKGGKYSAFIIMLIAIPLASNINYVLQIWLGLVPDHTAMFVQLVFLFVIFEAISNPLMTAAAATGEMKQYQLIVSPLAIMNIPISCGLLYIWRVPELVFVVSVVISILSVFARLFVLKRLIKIDAIAFTRRVIIPVTLVLVLSSILPFTITALTEDRFLIVLSRIIVAFVNTAIVIIFVGCDRAEQKYLYELALSKLHIQRKRL